MIGGVGILGGSFDPPHRAHLAMAQAALAALPIDTVHLVVAARPPHKSTQAITPYSHRLAMAQAMAQETDGIVVSPIDDVGDGPSYTADLLRRIGERFGGPLYFIIGADSLADLPRWRSPEKIVSLCTLVVFPRGEISMRCPLAGDVSLAALESPKIDVSSSMVREAVRRGDDIREMVPAAVATYIDTHSLYRNE